MFIDSPPSPNERLSLSDAFRFSCHGGLSCFNTCCQNKHLPLTPYDVLRLRTGLGMDSDDFLSKHTVYNTDPQTGFPVVSIRMQNDPEKTCPFVSPKGCTVYENRPTACRLYPMARAVSAAQRGEMRKEFYYLLHIPGCLGVKEKEVRTVQQWLDDQELLTCLTMNDRMVDFVLAVKKALGTPLDERGVGKVLAALYNLDLFRDFVLSTSLVEALGVEERVRSRVREDDLALLELGLMYLVRALAA